LEIRQLRAIPHGRRKSLSAIYGKSDAWTNHEFLNEESEMIYGKRDATGLYQDNRLKHQRSASPGVDGPIEDSMHLTKSSTVRLPLAARVKAMFRDLRRDKGVAVNKSRSYEIEIFPSHTQARKPQLQLSAANAIKSKKQIGALLLAAKSNHFWPVRKQNDCNVGQTPSNLG
jgi:hypothetical protein